MTSLRSAALLLLVPLLSLTPAEGPTAKGSQVVTLWAHDDLRSSFSFRRGGPGGRIEDGELILDDAQIAFDLFEPDLIAFGFVRDELVNVIDLEDLYVPGLSRPKDRAPKLSLSVFHTLFLDGQKIAYRGPVKRTYLLPAAQRIVHGAFPEGLRFIEPVIGHTYLLRFKMRSKEAGELHLVKFQVIDLQPGHSLTLRWASL